MTIKKLVYEIDRATTYAFYDHIINVEYRNYNQSSYIYNEIFNSVFENTRAHPLTTIKNSLRMEFKKHE